MIFVVNCIVNLKKAKATLACLCICGICVALMPTANSIMTAAGVAKSNGIRLPILMYHHVLDKSRSLNKYTVSPDEFESDLKYIKEQGYTTVVVADLINFCEKGTQLPEKPIMITFDDGYESVFHFACPLLKKYEMKAVINIIGKYADLYSECDDHNIRYSHITWQQLKQAVDENVLEVQNHTYDMHKNGKRNGIGKMRGESTEHYANAVGKDISELQERVKEKLGFYPTAFAYPFGTISKEALPVLKNIGFKAVFCCWEKVNYLTGEREELYHLNRFNRPHGKTTAEFFKNIENG